MQRYKNQTLTEERSYYYKGRVKTQEIAQFYSYLNTAQTSFGRWVYTFDNQENLISLVYQNLQNGFSFSRNYEHSDGNLIYQVYKNDSGYDLEKRQWVFDSENRPLRNLVDSNSYSDTVNGYNREGQLLIQEVFNRDGQITSSVENQYDDQGNIVLTNAYGLGKHLLTRQEFQYVYDRHGNWTKKLQYSTDNVLETYRINSSEAERTITYFY